MPLRKPDSCANLMDSTVKTKSMDSLVTGDGKQGEELNIVSNGWDSGLSLHLCGNTPQQKRVRCLLLQTGSIIRA